MLPPTSMTADGIEAGSQIAVTCPACSPDVETIHEVLSPGGHVTVRCLTCDHVHKQPLDSSPTIPIRTVVSIEEESERIEVDVPQDAVLAVGEEFVAETNDGPMGVRITSLERDDGARIETAHASEIATIWSRSVDNVAVSATVHPSGDRDESRSETYYLPGDEELAVGEAIPHLGEDLRIDGIILRDDAVAYDRRNLTRRGDSAFAKDTKRIYVTPTNEDQWRSAWG